MDYTSNLILDLCDRGEEPVGFLTEGHVNIDEFREACVKRQEWQFGLDEEDIDPLELVQHEWVILAPYSDSEGEGHYISVGEDWHGSFPVTMAYMENHKPYTLERHAKLEREKYERDERRAEERTDHYLKQIGQTLGVALDLLEEKSSPHDPTGIFIAAARHNWKAHLPEVPDGL